MIGASSPRVNSDVASGTEDGSTVLPSRRSCSGLSMCVDPAAADEEADPDDEALGDAPVVADDGVAADVLVAAVGEEAGDVSAEPVVATTTGRAATTRPATAILARVDMPQACHIVARPFGCGSCRR